MRWEVLRKQREAVVSEMKDWLQFVEPVELPIWGLRLAALLLLPFGVLFAVWTAAWTCLKALTVLLIEMIIVPFAVLFVWVDICIMGVWYLWQITGRMAKK